jgi:hypothetical protein
VTVSLIGRFEQRLERGVEGFFTRLFRSGVHPVEIGKRLLRVMEDGKTVALRRTYVPHVYRITIGPKDFERLGPLESKLIEELEIFIGEAARQREWSLPDSPQVAFALDRGLSAGEFRVAAEAVSLSTDDEAPVRERRRRARAESNGAPCLVLITDGEEVRTVPVPRRIRIGRQADNDLVISDPGVSRHHAEVTNENGSCTLRDLGSTNGTLVNGSAATEHPLRDGDRISLGSSVVEFRRG